MRNVSIVNGDCLQELRGMADSSVDSIVTDPPYGLANATTEKFQDALAKWVHGDREYIPSGRGFMGKDWDSFVPPPAVWDECLRVLKPGGHMAVFAGARTQDLMGLSIRLAGFEIRDTLGWVYGQGFPKSASIGKSDLFCQCDKGMSLNGTKSEAEYEMRDLRERNVSSPLSASSREGEVLQPSVQEYSASSSGWEELSGSEVRAGESCMEGRGDAQEKEGKLRRASVCSLPGEMEVHGKVGRVHHGAPTCDGGVDREAAPQVGGGESYQSESQGQSQGELGTVSFERGSQEGGGRTVCAGCGKPASPSGLGTALKPAIEPIILARKPLDGTVAANVLAHGVGGLNIDASRVGTEGGGTHCGKRDRHGKCLGHGDAGKSQSGATFHADESNGTAGRFPANVLLDEHAAAEMDKQSGVTASGKPSRDARYGTYEQVGENQVYGKGLNSATPNTPPKGDSGGASRFFPVFKYQAKAPKKERPVIEREDGSKIQHPTVKPVALMEWLVTLITPEGGSTLDPFAGSGATLQAAINKGFNVIGIEQDGDYCKLIEERLKEV